MGYLLLTFVFFEFKKETNLTFLAYVYLEVMQKEIQTMKLLNFSEGTKRGKGCQHWHSAHRRQRGPDASAAVLHQFGASRVPAGACCCCSCSSADQSAQVAKQIARFLKQFFEIISRYQSMSINILNPKTQASKTSSFSLNFVAPPVARPQPTASAPVPVSGPPPPPGA